MKVNLNKETKTLSVLIYSSKYSDSYIKSIIEYVLNKHGVKEDVEVWDSVFRMGKCYTKEINTVFDFALCCYDEHEVEIDNLDGMLTTFFEETYVDIAIFKEEHRRDVEDKIMCIAYREVEAIEELEDGSITEYVSKEMQEECEMMCRDCMAYGNDVREVDGKMVSVCDRCMYGGKL